ncbi:hypothetical protein [Streptomyces lincolnensis]|uniref:hypothetical protein n=1 Tax=Streptomyces lincolnensis TaxID=1915 RepID=UPI0037D7A3CA
MKQISRSKRKTAAVLGAALAVFGMLGIVSVAQAATVKHVAADRTSDPDEGHAPWIAPYPPNLGAA